MQPQLALAAGTGREERLWWYKLYLLKKGHSFLFRKGRHDSVWTGFRGAQVDWKLIVLGV